MRRPFIAMLATGLTLGVAACGEKDEPEPAAPTGSGGQDVEITTTKPTGDGGNDGGQKLSPQQEIEANVIAVLGGGDPSVCSELATARYVRVAYGDEQGCRAASAKQGTFDVTVSAVEIRGRTASAKAEPSGGPNKRETIRVELVDEGGTWKVDSALSNAPAGP